MHILMLTPFYGTRYGGVGVHTYELANSLTAAGHVVDVLAPKDSCWQTDSRANVVGVPNFGPMLTRAPNGGRHLVTSNRPSGIWSMVNGIQQNLGMVTVALSQLQAADVVHVHSRYTVTAGEAIANTWNVPLVMTKHDMLSDSEVAFRKWHNDVIQYARALESVGDSTADAIICPSEAARTELLNFRQTGASTETHTIPNGATLTNCWGTQCREEYRTKRGSSVFTVGFFARLEPIKGVDQFVDLVEKLPPDTHVRIAGGGSARADLEARVGELGLTNRVEFLGYLDREDVHEFLHSIDLLVYPTVADVFPIVVAEAQLAGTPVLAAAVGGVTEQIVDNQTGFLYEPDDGLEGLISRLSSITAEDRARVSRSSPEQARERYDWNTIARATARIYADVAGTRSDA